MTIFPSPGLNLIIGPNGSGKSSIICAIGLGLGASPSLLARSNKITGFIRHSCKEAIIKILLTADPPFWVCRRISSDNSTQWRIKFPDGKWKQTTNADVLQRIQALHIQLDNLCMFLPQERVKEFSTLKPTQLLSATEQAINIQAYSEYQSLLRDFQSQKDITQKINDLQNNLQIYQSEVERMHNDVVRYRQIEECKANIEKYEKKIPWVIYQNVHQEYREVHQQLRKEIGIYKKTKKELSPLTDEIERLKGEKGGTIKYKEAFQNTKSIVIKLSQQMFQNENKLQGIKAKLSTFKDEQQQRNKKLEQLQTILEQKSQIPDSQENVKELDNQRKELQKKHNQLKLNESETSQQISSCNLRISKRENKMKEINKRIKSFEDEKNQLIRHLQKNLGRNNEIQLYQYIEDHKNQFEGNVYGPICIELQFSEPRNANIIQMIVENQYLLSFLAEKTRDFNTIFAYTKQNKIDGINLSNAEDVQQSQSQLSQCPNLSEYGFTNYADELFEAPYPVKKMLCNIAKLDRIPVGKGNKCRQSIEMLQKEIFPKYGINRYFIDDLFYIMYKSRQGNTYTIISTPIRQSNIWRSIVNQKDNEKNLIEEKEKIELKIKKIKKELNDINLHSRNIKDELSEVTRQIQEIKDKIQNNLTLRNKLDQIKLKIKQLKKEIDKDPQLLEEYQNKLQIYIKNKAKICKELGNKLQQIINDTKELDKALFNEQKINSRLMELQEQLEEENQKYAEQERLILELNNKKEELEREQKKRQNEAKEKCELTPENKEMMATLPGDLDILKSELANYKARYAAIAHIDPTIAQRFAQAENKRNETKAKLEELQKKSEDNLIELDKRFTNWKQVVSNDINLISNSFTELMNSCGYRGEVHLDYDVKEKLETYKLNLLVAFNKVSKLNILSSSRQSGGEKSVTTLMYLLALQDCTKFPFRVVDEINQGMDEVNDRNTFSQVMSYAIRKNQASQYFLVTPKLLPELDLLDGVTVLVVMNGPFVDNDLSMPITFDS
ncbi:structural maintenance of chromosomes protein 5 [Histomonas meleagridis]|uniref:structural maintenance of chromosomes protein 5 n=1 Tax=Histomonas meleagridis TaxID=135588 RepID=UPI003559A6B9|nr:structural maintenance of chromosomes protein 5 [Histomonas meleagridis]KAH0805255.1 structural maintenance of chromosomes protein 5 [Histomonas meleagridis]